MQFIAAAGSESRHQHMNQTGWEEEEEEEAEDRGSNYLGGKEQNEKEQEIIIRFGGFAFLPSGMDLNFSLCSPPTQG